MYIITEGQKESICIYTAIVSKKVAKVNQQHRKSASISSKSSSISYYAK